MTEISKNEYQSFLLLIKQEIQLAQQKTISQVNKSLIFLYYSIGKIVSNKQQKLKWGAKVIDKLSNDIKNELPKIKGFSSRNIKLMVQFYKEYSQNPIGQPLVAQNQTHAIPEMITQISWTHNTILMQKVKDLHIRHWYIEKTLENGWSKNVLSLMIKSKLHNREAKLTSNFKQILPPVDSDLVNNSFKDPYIFDFLTIAQPFREKELELNLVKHMEKFLLELGSGFAFVNRQYKVKLDDNEYYIDLLFYHLKLRCYVVIELKKGKFKPEYCGQVNFYCSAIDDILAHKDDKPTIGLILCQEKNTIVAEYSLKNMSQPIGISEYQLTEVLPKEYQSALPSIRQIEAEFSDV